MRHHRRLLFPIVFTVLVTPGFVPDVHALASPIRANVHGSIHTLDTSNHGAAGITFTTNKGNTNSSEALYTVGLDGSNPQPFYGVQSSHATWTSDGSRLATSDSVGNIYTMNPDGSDFKQLPAYSIAFNIAWSPDGTKLAFWGGNEQLSYINRDGTGLKEVVGSTGVGADCWRYLSGGISWADNNTILFVNAAHYYQPKYCDSGIFKVSLSGGSPIPVLVDNSGHIDSTAVSPFDLKLAYSKYDSDNYVSRIYVGDTPITPVTQDITTFSWSPDGQLFVYDNRKDNQIYIIPAGGGTPIQVTQNLPPTWYNQDPTFQPQELKVSIGNVSVDAGSVTPVDAKFPITLSHASTSEVDVNYSTADGTAVAGKDYTPASNLTLQIPPGETSATVDISLFSQPGPVANKQFTVTISSPVHALLGNSTGTATIGAQPSIINISTATGAKAAMKGGYEMHISGNHLEGATEVDFLDPGTGAVLATARADASNGYGVTLRHVPDLTKAESHRVGLASDSDLPTTIVVKVKAGGGTFTSPVTADGAFTFAIPVIKNLDPAYVPAKGNVPVTLKGEYLTGADYVSLSAPGVTKTILAKAKVSKDDTLTFTPPDLTKLFAAARVAKQFDSHGDPYIEAAVLLPVDGSFHKSVSSGIGKQEDHLGLNLLSVTKVDNAYVSPVAGQIQTIRGEGLDCLNWTGSMALLKYKKPDGTPAEITLYSGGSVSGLGGDASGKTGSFRMPDFTEEVFNRMKNAKATGAFKVDVIIECHSDGNNPNNDRVITSASSPGDEFMVGPPRVKSLSPSSAPAKGSTQHLIVGTGLFGVTSVTLGTLDHGHFTPIVQGKNVPLLNNVPSDSGTQIHFIMPDFREPVREAGGRLTVFAVANIPVPASLGIAQEISSVPVKEAAIKLQLGTH